MILATARGKHDWSRKHPHEDPSAFSQLREVRNHRAFGRVSDGSSGDAWRYPRNPLNEHSHLSPEMALRIEKAFGVSMEMLMRMQKSYDIAQARKRERKIKVMPYKGLSGDTNQSAPYADQL